jgi:hypothetical protein
MVVSPTDLLLFRGTMSTRQFVDKLAQIPGSPPIAGLVLDNSESTQAVCPWTARVWTPDTTIAGQVTRVGGGFVRAEPAASSRYWTTPDTTNVSFGNGSNDSSMSFVALINTNDTAANKTLFSKFNSGASTREYLVTITSAEVFNWQLIDQSAGVVVGLTGSGAVPFGQWVLVGGSYDGGGGATAANGMVAYQNGAVMATSPTNNASYVAMENLTAPLELGSLDAHTTQYFDGTYGFFALYTKTLTATQHAGLAQLCRQYFRVTL